MGEVEVGGRGEVGGEGREGLKAAAKWAAKCGGEVGGKVGGEGHEGREGRGEVGGKMSGEGREGREGRGEVGGKVGGEVGGKVGGEGHEGREGRGEVGGFTLALGPVLAATRTRNVKSQIFSRKVAKFFFLLDFSSSFSFLTVYVFAFSAGIG